MNFTCQADVIFSHYSQIQLNPSGNAFKKDEYVQFKMTVQDDIFLINASDPCGKHPENSLKHFRKFIAEDGISNAIFFVVGNEAT